MKHSLFTAIAAAFALAGCVSVLPEAAPAAPRYVLEPVSYESAPAAAVEWSLIVDDPLSTRVYDTTKMALRRAPGRVEYFAAGEWADRVPRLVQSTVIRSFENSGRILTVGDRVTQPRGDFVLQTDIRAFHARYDAGAPSAVVSIHARVTDRRGRVVAARLFEEERAASANSVADVAAAFDDVVSSVVRSMTDWTFETAQAEWAAPS